jgi:pSer/pThr/pTyr-binding forkhead associated (FHA) protein
VSQIEVWALSGRTYVDLSDDRATIGKGAENKISLSGDPTVSRLHAVIERFDTGWCVSDLGSSNGTYLNGERIWAAQRLRNGDEIRVGRTRLLFRDADDLGRTVTETDEGAPRLTPRERDVLVVLCKPLLARDQFTEPSSIKEIAAELVVSDAAVKQHLQNLYDKFGVAVADRRRTRLANEAIRRGAVRLADLRGEPSV